MEVKQTGTEVCSLWFSVWSRLISFAMQDEQLTEERNMRTEETSVLVLQLTECSAESQW